MKLRMLTAVLALSLTNCVSVLPEPEVPNGLYRLGTVEPSAAIKHNLVVREPEGSRVFSGKAMAAIGDDGVLKLIRGVEWSQSASRMLQLGLLDAIGTEGGGLALDKSTGAPVILSLLGACPRSRSMAASRAATWSLPCLRDARENR